VAARDGLSLPVWVTTPPKGASSTAPRPTVVMVHGGPWVRGSHWEWEPMRQFLATRGFLVIEPEFRGSAGFGRRLFRAGWRQWGRTMQDDVADALGWAVKKGLADPAKVCIIGASYGGYATLMGLIRHPDLYRCGAAWAAVTDPRLMFKWSYTSNVSSEGREYSYPKLIGDPVADAEMLESVTPVLLADQIKAPLLLVMGGQDRRVLPEHGQRLRDAMKAAGHPPEFIEYPTEGHGWLQLETQVDFARRLEAFLARNLQ
jgi:dipeptidyl aminopeptidase/acylaminoacyl peptidase